MAKYTGPLLSSSKHYPWRFGVKWVKNLKISLRFWRLCLWSSRKRFSLRTKIHKKKEYIRLIICTFYQSFLMIHQHYPLSYLSSNHIHVQSQQNGRRDAWRLVKVTSIEDIVKSSRTSNKFTIYSSFFTANFKYIAYSSNDFIASHFENLSITRNSLKIKFIQR